jgi:2,3-bisphosphoglycerate-independent phosphoglycerate mutase
MKILLILLDGVGDRSYVELNHQTPLQAAKIPNLDRLAALGGNGMFHASFPGECLPSEIAHFLMFGYDRQDFPGRGLLEAAGDNVPFDDGDVLALAHFSKVRVAKGKCILTKGRDGIKSAKDDLGRLYQAVASFETDGVRFALHQTRRNDGIIVISGDVSPFISDSDPITAGKTIGRILSRQNNPEPDRAGRTAEALNQYLVYCHQTLSADPKLSKTANFLVTQRCGRRRLLPPFTRIWGLRPLMIASASIYEGLAHELGFDFVRAVDGKNPGLDLKQRIQMALDDPDHDFFHVHTKVPDDVSHKGTPLLKKQALEALDRGLVNLVKTVEKNDDVLVIITGDHSTPSDSTLIHSGETVPVIMAGPRMRRDRVAAFDEVSAAGGCLGLLRGKELMYMALNFSERSVLVTHQLGNEISPFIPDNYTAFTL